MGLEGVIFTVTFPDTELPLLSAPHPAAASRKVAPNKITLRPAFI